MKYTNLEIEKILELYEKGLSYKIIEEKTGKEKSGLIRMLKRTGAYKPRSLRKHQFNESYFDEINTETKAYWLGFILADAYIRNTKLKKCLVITLSTKDENHLIEFQKEIDFKGPIKHLQKTIKGKTHKLSRLTITSSKLVRSLVKIGASSFKKKGSLQIIKYISNKLLRYLIRGLFDGDGMVYLHTPSKQIGMGFCDKHYEVVHWFQSQLIHGVKVKPVKINVSKSKQCYRFQYRGNNQVRRIGTWLYDIKGPCLERKRTFFQTF